MQWWLLPNFFSLDAPVVAVLWQAFVGRCFPSPLRVPAEVVLGMTVWSIYLLDRLLDVRTPALAGESARHEFYRKNRKSMTGLLAAVVLVDLVVTIVWLRPAVFHAGIVLAAGVLCYLGLLHFTRGRVRLPKELVVAVLFTAGVFLVSWISPTLDRRSLLPAAAVFCLLCLANLVAIENWEWQELRSGHSGAPGRLTRWLGQLYLVWVPALAFVAALTAARWYVAISLSAASMALLFAARSHLSLGVRRAMIDAALLTPALFLQ